MGMGNAEQTGLFAIGNRNETEAQIAIIELFSNNA